MVTTYIYIYCTVTDGNILLHHSATLDNTSFTLEQLYEFNHLVHLYIFNVHIKHSALLYRTLNHPTVNKITTTFVKPTS